MPKIFIFQTLISLCRFPKTKGVKTMKNIHNKDSLLLLALLRCTLSQIKNIFIYDAYR